MSQRSRIVGCAVLLASVLGLGACMTPEPASRRLYDTFGMDNAWERTGTHLANIPLWLSWELRRGGEDMGDFAYGMVRQTRKDLGRTADNIFGAPGFLIDDSRRHLRILGEQWDITFADPTIRDAEQTGETLATLPGDLVHEVDHRTRRLGQQFDAIAQSEVKRSKTFFGRAWDFLQFMLF